MKWCFFLFLVAFFSANILPQINTFQNTLGTENEIESGKFLLAISDGNLIGGGITSNAIKVFKLNSYGDTIMSRIIPGNFDISLPLPALIDRDSIIISTTILGTTNNILILKMDASLNIVWQKTFDRSESYSLYDLELTNDYGFILMGYYSDNRNVEFLRLNVEGEQIWVNEYDIELSNFYQKTFNVFNISNGDFIFAARQKFGKLDADGNLISVISKFSYFCMAKVDDSSFIVGSGNQIIKIDTDFHII